MVKRKRPNVFTKEELKVMEAMWRREDELLTRYDIADDLKIDPRSVASTIQRLLEKKMIRNRGSKPRGTRLAKVYSPAVSRKDYLSSMMGFMRASDLFSTNDFVFALVDIAEEDDENFEKAEKIKEILSDDQS